MTHAPTHAESWETPELDRAALADHRPPLAGGVGPGLVPTTTRPATRSDLPSGLWDRLEMALDEAASGAYPAIALVRRTVHETAAILRSCGVPHALAAEAIVRRVERRRLRDPISAAQVRFWSRAELYGA